MTCQEHDLQAGDYVDGTLAPPLRAAFEVHLAGCERCRMQAADFGAIRAVARTLEPHLPPTRVWANIAAALAPRKQVPWWRGAFAVQYAAAAAMVILLVAGLSWIGGALAPPTPAAAVATIADDSDSVTFGYAVAEAELTTTIAGLEEVAAADGGALDPDTADVLQANLTLIDTAIDESRAALATEPASPLALETLFEALRSKVTLLQDMIALINEMRQGNPDGAARIISGLNQ